METASPSPTAVPYVPDQPKASNRSLTAIARGLTTAIETTNRRSASGLRSVARLETHPSATPRSDGSRTSAPGRLVTRASAHSAPRSSRVTVATAGPKSPVVEGPVSGAAPVAGASGPCQGEWVIGAPAGLTIREARPPRLRTKTGLRRAAILTHDVASDFRPHEPQLRLSKRAATTSKPIPRPQARSATPTAPNQAALNAPSETTNAAATVGTVSNRRNKEGRWR